MAQTEGVPKGLWIKCNACREILYHREVSGNLDVCPRCGYHFRISATRRLELLFDNKKYKRFFDGILDRIDRHVHHGLIHRAIHGVARSDQPGGVYPCRLFQVRQIDHDPPAVPDGQTRRVGSSSSDGPVLKDKSRTPKYRDFLDSQQEEEYCRKEATSTTAVVRGSFPQHCLGSTH